MMIKFHKEHVKENVPPVLKSENETLYRSLIFKRHLGRQRSIRTISSSLPATELQEMPFTDERDQEEEKDRIEQGKAVVFFVAVIKYSVNVLIFL